jgi:hypothetical protein
MPILCAAVPALVAADPASLEPALVIYGLLPPGCATAAAGLASPPTTSEPTVMVLSPSPAALTPLPWTLALSPS